MKLEIKKQHSINPYVLVIVSFLLVILIGSILLTMPWTQTSGQWGTYIDALVTATSATCVTGVSTYPTGVACSLTFGGQLVTIILVQIGGLGFITLLTFIITLFNSKLQFKDRYLISQMVNSTSAADVVKFVRKIIFITLVCEFVGTLFGLPVFLTMYPNNIWQALWNCVFHSISAFNNAGFDLFNSTTSLIGSLEGVNGETVSSGLYYYFCSYEMLLIILGGISFLVIIEMVIQHKKTNQLRAFTKIVLCTTAILIVGGAALLFLSDGLKAENPMTVFDALFQSVSCRTAGFMTYSQDDISVAGKVICSLLMFFGGAPLSTAGGIKITTVYIVFLAIICYFGGKKVSSFNRVYSNNMVLKAMALVFTGLLIIILGYIGFNAFGLEEGIEYSSLGLKTSETLMYLYETFSAFGTVGFFCGIEPSFSLGSKIVLCLLMFMGRLGPFTFLQIFQTNLDKKIDTHYNMVEEDFLIG